MVENMNLNTRNFHVPIHLVDYVIRFGVPKQFRYIANIVVVLKHLVLSKGSEDMAP
jgi:hypothetical protein